MFLYVASYCLADFAHMVWWLIVIVDAVIAILFVVISFMTAAAGRRISPSTSRPIIKITNSAARSAKKKEKAEGENYVPPEIKSFKDRKIIL